MSDKKGSGKHSSWLVIRHTELSNTSGKKICPIYRMKELAELALADLADELGWEVKNHDRVKYDKVSPIYRTS